MAPQTRSKKLLGKEPKKPEPKKPRPHKVYRREFYESAFRKVSSSVVIVTRTNELMAAGIDSRYCMGMVWRHVEDFTVVAVHNRNIQDNGRMTVTFSDNTVCPSNDIEFIGKTGNFSFLRLRNKSPNARVPRWQARSVVLSNKNLAKGEEIFTILPVQECFSMLTSKIISPACVTQRKESGDMFSFTCPFSLTYYPGPEEDERSRITLERVSGAPVFNMAGQVVGTIGACSTSAHHLKFGNNSRTISCLESWLQCNDWKAGHGPPPSPAPAPPALPPIAAQFNLLAFKKKEDKEAE